MKFQCCYFLKFEIIIYEPVLITAVRRNDVATVKALLQNKKINTKALYILNRQFFEYNFKSKIEIQLKSNLFNTILKQNILMVYQIKKIK